MPTKACCSAGHRTALVSKELLSSPHSGFFKDTLTVGGLCEDGQTVPYSWRLHLSGYPNRPPKGPIENPHQAQVAGPLRMGAKVP